ncbi:MAG TPA: Spy/CpxP family protein refolding chaperone [Pseudolabrys sp.]|nr:Spy/CpxP family protein refolding chaperone [Pseudolabrys sp.]
MRRLVLITSLILLAFLSAMPEPARAQLSPQGLIGTITRPFRSMLGRLSFAHHRAPRHTAEAAPPSPAQDRHFGNVGPAVWPAAYEDVVGYVFWPQDYTEALRGRGFDVIADTVLQSPSIQKPVETATTGSARASETGDKPNGVCDDPADSAVIWPIADIEQSEQLTGVERGALGHLQTALAQALNTVNAGCSDDAAQSPRERLHILVQRLWAVRDAGIFVRAPLKEFYDSLNDEQKTKFKIPQSASKDAQDKKQDAKLADAAKQQYQACAARGGESAERLIQKIAQTVHPTKDQDAALKALRKTTGDMAKLLGASCDPSIPADPMARLDAANNQLTSMNYAATSMEIALNGFYAQLTADQKAKFNGLGG